MKATIRAGLVGLALVLTGTLVGASPTEARSAACSIQNADYLVAGRYVQVQDDQDTSFRSSCLRIYGTNDGWNHPVRQYGNRVWVTSQLRDTARDGQIAVGMVRFQFFDGSVSSWSILQTTGAEYWGSAETAYYRMIKTPMRVQFAACRSASSSGRPTNACGFSPWYWTPESSVFI